MKDINKREALGMAVINYYKYKNSDMLVDMNIDQFFTACHLILKAIDELEKEDDN